MEKCKVFVMIYNSKFHLNVYYFNYIITEIWQMQFLRMAWNETHIIYTNNILQQYINLKPPKHKTIKHVFVPVHVTNIKGVTFYSWGNVMKT